MKRIFLITWMGMVMCTGSILANITLPRILGHNMVLQQQKPVPVWGTAAPGEAVRVRFHGQAKQGIADAQGHWQVWLDPMTASSAPADLTIAGSNSIILHDILVGEVWLCSGQSNMEYTMRKNSKVVKTDSSAASPVDELQRANNPAIRIFLVTNKNLRAPDSLHTGWSEARDSALRSFSAAGYFFAKELYSKLRVPIGVISSAVPGSAIEPWMMETVRADSSRLVSAQTGARHGPLLVVDSTRPGKFVPTMVAPLALFALRGFLWYQGETNCFQNERFEYTEKMELLIRGWRRLWRDTALPFYYVGIAPFYYSRTKNQYPLTEETLPRFWTAQYEVMRRVPHTGMVVTTDLVRTPDDLHPGFKWEIGRRLAQWALANEYGMKVTPSGPVVRQVLYVKGTVELVYTGIGKGLISRDGRPLNWFSLRGANGKWLPAQARIDGNKVYVSSADLPEPTAVRFGWNEAAQPNLFNKDGLPAMPFLHESRSARELLDQLPSIKSVEDIPHRQTSDPEPEDSHVDEHAKQHHSLSEEAGGSIRPGNRVAAYAL